VLQYVQPIIDLAKRNIDHNAKKNDRFKDLEKKIEMLQQ
jgi:hypothetical protein